MWPAIGREFVLHALAGRFSEPVLAGFKSGIGLVIVENARHSLIEPDAVFSPSLMEIYQIIVDFLAQHVQ